MQPLKSNNERKIESKRDVEKRKQFWLKILMTGQTCFKLERIPLGKIY